MKKKKNPLSDRVPRGWCGTGSKLKRIARALARPNSTSNRYPSSSVAVAFNNNNNIITIHIYSHTQRVRR